MSTYDFEGLWFQIYQNVIQHNEKLGQHKLDKNQQRLGRIFEL